MVDANRVGPDSLHERRIKPALCCVDERVIGDELVRNACCELSVAALLPIDYREDVYIPLTKN
jgi:hypothetical protein